MQLRYDLNVGALYIRFSSRAISRSREVDGNTVVDLDEAGGVVGIEVLSIEHPWPVADVLRGYSIPRNRGSHSDNSGT